MVAATLPPAVLAALAKIPTGISPNALSTPAATTAPAAAPATAAPAAATPAAAPAASSSAVTPAPLWSNLPPTAQINQWIKATDPYYTYLKMSPADQATYSSLMQQIQTASNAGNGNSMGKGDKPAPAALDALNAQKGALLTKYGFNLPSGYQQVNDALANGTLAVDPKTGALAPPDTQSGWDKFMSTIIPILTMAGVGGAFLGPALGLTGNSASAAGTLPVGAAPALDPATLMASTAAPAGAGITDVGFIGSAAGSAAAPTAAIESAAALPSIGANTLAGLSIPVDSAAIASGITPLTAADLAAVTTAAAPTLGSTISSGALKGAASGGVNAALTGGNVGQGMLTGGAAGGVGAGAGSLAGSAASSAGLPNPVSSTIGSSIGSYTGSSVASGLSGGSSPPTGTGTMTTPTTAASGASGTSTTPDLSTLGGLGTTVLNGLTSGNPLSGLTSALGSVPTVDALALYEANQAKSQNAALAGQLTSQATPLLNQGQADLGSYQSLSPTELASMQAGVTGGNTLTGEANPLIGLGQQAMNQYGQGQLQPWQQQQLDQANKDAKAKALQALGPNADSSTMAQVMAQIDNQTAQAKGQMLSQNLSTGETAYNQGTALQQQGTTDVTQAYNQATTDIQNNLKDALSMITAGLGPLEESILLQISGNTALTGQLQGVFSAIAKAQAAAQTTTTPTQPAAGTTASNALSSLTGAGSSAVTGLQSLLNGLGGSNGTSALGGNLGFTIDPTTGAVTSTPSAAPPAGFGGSTPWTSIGQGLGTGTGLTGSANIGLPAADPLAASVDSLPPIDLSTLDLGLNVPVL